MLAFGENIDSIDLLYVFQQLGTFPATDMNPRNHMVEI